MGGDSVLGGMRCPSLVRRICASACWPRWKRERRGVRRRNALRSAPARRSSGCLPLGRRISYCAIQALKGCVRTSRRRMSNWSGRGGGYSALGRQGQLSRPGPGAAVARDAPARWRGLGNRSSRRRDASGRPMGNVRPPSLHLQIHSGSGLESKLALIKIVDGMPVGTA